MFKRKKIKNAQHEEIEYGFDIQKEDHPLGEIDKNYLWKILRTNNGCTCVYSCGWAISSDQAWIDANESYKELIKNK